MTVPYAPVMSNSDNINTNTIHIDIDKAGKKKSLIGGSLFSSSSGPSAPPEIQPLVSLQIAVSKAVASTTSAIPTADAEYDKLTDPSKPSPTPPVHAARLSALVKSLANAEGAVSESIKARRSLIEGLEKIIETNRTTLSAEETQKDTLASRKNAIEAKKREVEDRILRGLSAESTPVAQGSPGPASRPNGSTASPSDDAEPERPHVEELTPPPPGSLTPITPQAATQTEPVSTIEQPPTPADPRLTPRTPSVAPPQQQTAGADLLSSLSVPAARHYHDTSGSPDGGPMKRQKMDDDYPVFGTGEDAMADLDADVAELLRAESGGAH